MLPLLSSSTASPVLSPAPMQQDMPANAGLQVAPNMSTLLHSLKNLRFESQLSNSNNPNDKPLEECGSGRRSAALSTLMTLISAQAEQVDAFKIITINTELKRVIMACNRQGRPPPSVETDPNTPVVLSASSKSGRSVRCQCRMRVNINYHSKLRAWRVTSFEATHNHGFGRMDNSADTADKYRIHEKFVITQQDVQNAILKTAGRTQVTVSSAASTLAQFAQSSIRASTSPMYPMSYPGTPNTSKIAYTTPYSARQASPDADRLSLKRTGPPLEHWHTNPNSPRFPGTLQLKQEFLQRQVMPSSNGLSQYQPMKIDTSNVNPVMNHNQSMHTGQLFPGQTKMHMLPPIRNLIHRENSSPASNENTIIGRRRSKSNLELPTLQMKAPVTSARSQLDHLANTALEVDRYATMHSCFKSVIALACKKPEWTSECLAAMELLESKFRNEETSYRQTKHALPIASIKSDTADHVSTETRPMLTPVSAATE